MNGNWNQLLIERAKREAMRRQGVAPAVGPTETAPVPGTLGTMLERHADRAGGFAEVGERGFGAMTQEGQQAREHLRRLSEGKESVSAEQLRQANDQNLANQRSFAASAAPQNAPMAARTAMMNMNRASTGLAGQQAVAGLAERQAAQKALMDSILQQRQQDMQAALGGRGLAIQGLGTSAPNVPSWWDKHGKDAMQAGGMAAGLIAMSDERLKEDVEDGDGDANKAIDGLRAFTYKYRDQRHGKGKQVGIMAQDLERAGLGHAVMETPHGKAVHAGKLAGSNTAMLAALGKRVAELEKRKK